MASYARLPRVPALLPSAVLRFCENRVGSQPAHALAGIFMWYNRLQHSKESWKRESQLPGNIRHMQQTPSHAAESLITCGLAFVVCVCLW